MAYVTIQTVPITAGDSVSDPIEVGGFDKVAIVAQTFSVYCLTASCALGVEGSVTSTTSTFVPLHHMGIYSAGSGLLQWTCNHGTGNYMVTCDPAPYTKYIRMKLTNNTATASTNISVVLVKLS